MKNLPSFAWRYSFVIGKKQAKHTRLRVRHKYLPLLTCPTEGHL